jgi:hypothetical protein
MAKKGSRQGTTRQRNVNASKTMVDFAEDLGRLLGTAQAKASNWLNQRKNVIEELTQLRDTANQLLTDLAGSSAGAARGGRRGPRAAANGGTSGQSTAAAGARKGGRRKMSAAARREVSQRMRRYWAARRKEKAAQG